MFKIRIFTTDSLFNKSARGSPSVSFRDEHTSRNTHNNSYLARQPSTAGIVNRPVDIPRPPSSAQKLKTSSKPSANGKNIANKYFLELPFMFIFLDISNRTWHATNTYNYVEE